MADGILENLKKTGLNPSIHIITTQPDFIIFEFQVHDPANLRQDELQKITVGKDGFYILHYAIKQPDMGQVNRDKWLKNLQASKIFE